MESIRIQLDQEKEEKGGERERNKTKKQENKKPQIAR